MPPSSPLSAPGGYCRPPSTVPYSTQETNFYCGPACEQMLIAGMTGIRPRQWLLYCVGRQEDFDPRWYTTPHAIARVLNRYRPRRCSNEFRDFAVASAAEATAILAASGGAGVAAVFRGLHFVVVNEVAPASAGGWVVITDPSRRNAASHSPKKYRVLSPWEWLGTYLLPVEVPGRWHGRYTVIAGSEPPATPPPTRLSAAMMVDSEPLPGDACPVRGERLTDAAFERIRGNLCERMLKTAAQRSARSGFAHAPAPGDVSSAGSPSPAVTVRCPGSADGEYRLFSDVVTPDGRSGYTVHLRYPNFSFSRGDTGDPVFPVAEVCVRSGARPLFSANSPILMSPRQLLEAVRLKAHGLPPVWRKAIRRATSEAAGEAKRPPEESGTAAPPNGAAREEESAEIRVVPEAYWEVCAESRDPMEPFRVLELGSRRLYIREDFAVFESLSPTMPVVDPESDEPR